MARPGLENKGLVTFPCVAVCVPARKAPPGFELENKGFAGSLARFGQVKQGITSRKISVSPEHPVENPSQLPGRGPRPRLPGRLPHGMRGRPSMHASTQEVPLPPTVYRVFVIFCDNSDSRPGLILPGFCCDFRGGIRARDSKSSNVTERIMRSGLKMTLRTPPVRGGRASVG
jgi:hypothetical protein